MKKYSIFAAVLLSLGMFVFSCDKVESDIQTPEEIVINDVQPVEMTFTAYIAAKDATTKSVTDGGVTAWVAGEEINVYYQKTDLSYDSATATVGTPRVDGSAPISATLTSAKDGTPVKFVYPAGLADATGDLNAAALAIQHGTIDDISVNFDAATGTGTLVTDGTSCSTEAMVTMTNQVLIGKFTPKYSSTAINALTSLTIWDGKNTYTITPEAPATEFGNEGIYVAMLPVAGKRVVISANTASAFYHFDMESITLEVGKLYTNLEIPMNPVTRISNSSANVLREALASASNGDIIEMAASDTYATSNDNYIEFDGKEITVVAAAGASVTIIPQVPIQVEGGAKAEFIDIIFDASRLDKLNNWYEHLIYASDDNASNRLVLNHCEVKNFTMNKSVIYCSKTNKFESVVFNNCYFHDITKSCFFAEGQVYEAANPSAEPPTEEKPAITSVGSFTMTNSTVANITTVTGSYYAGIFDARGPGAVVTVDHCTFYNCLPMNTDHGVITVNQSTQTTNSVSNCIFVMPTDTEQRGIRFNDGVKGQISYCITNHYTASTNGIKNGSATKTACSVADPLFANAASGDFTLGATSPARTASATSGPIGDPRWY